eukprot:s1619_g5.t2
MQIEDATLWWDVNEPNSLPGLCLRPAALRRDGFDNRLQMMRDIRRDDLFMVMVGLLRVTAMLWVECCQLVYMHPHVQMLVSPDVEVEVEPEDEEGDGTAWMQGWKQLKRPASDMEPTDLTELLQDEEEASRDVQTQRDIEEEHAAEEARHDSLQQQEAEQQGRDYEMQKYRDWESWTVLNTPSDPPRRLRTRVNIQHAHHSGTADCEVPLVRGAGIRLTIEMNEVQGGEDEGSEGRTLGDDMNQYYIQWMKREISDEDVVARVGQDMYQVLLAADAGAQAVLIFDTVDVQATAILAVPGPFENPRIPAFLISKAEGEALQSQLEDGEELLVACSWSPLEIWFGLPLESPKANDSLLLTNVGDEDMDWVIDVIDTNETFGKDPFYRAEVARAHTDLAQDFQGESWDHLTLFNGTVELDDVVQSVPLPFDFPHYLEFSDRIFVTSNGLLGFHPFDLLGSAAIGGPGGPHGFIAAPWADFVLPVNATISARWQSTPTQLTILYRDLMLKEPPVGPFRFRVSLASDGAIAVLLEDFPTQNISSWSSELKLGLEPSSGALALNVSVPWDLGPPLALSLRPWLLLRGHSRIPPNESRQLNLSFAREEDLHAWFFLYAEQSIGSWHPRRNIRVVQRVFRFSWMLGPWDGGLHSGACAVATTRHRNRSCVGSDGAQYDDSLCLGSCMDLDPTYGDGYPTRRLGNLPRLFGMRFGD